MSEDDRLDQATGFLADEPADTAPPAEVDALGERVIEALRTVYDPEIPVNIFELGLIYKVDIDDDSHVHIDMTLTSPACPVAGTLPDEVRDKVAAVEGVAGAERRGGLGSALASRHDDRGSPARARHDLLRIRRRRTGGGLSADTRSSAARRGRAQRNRPISASSCSSEP